MAFRFFILFVCVAIIHASEFADEVDDEEEDFESRSPPQSNFNTTTSKPSDNIPFGKPANLKPFENTDSSFSDKPKDSFTDPIIVSPIASSTYDPFYKATITSSPSYNETSQTSSSSITYMFGKPLIISTSSSNTKYLFDNISPTSSSSTYSFGATNEPMETLPFTKNKIVAFGKNDESSLSSLESMNSSSSIYSVTPSLQMTTASISAQNFQAKDQYTQVTDSSQSISSTYSSSFVKDYTNVPFNFPVGASSDTTQSVTYPNTFNPIDNSSTSKSSISSTTSSSIFPYKTASFRR